MNPIIPFTAATACAIASLATGDVGLMFAGLVFAFVGIMSE
jgi:hypothetical protein